MKPLLHGFTADGQDARLQLGEEGELVGFLMLEIPRPVVMRHTDQGHVFSVKLRTFFGRSGRIVDPAGRVIAELKHSKRDFIARAPAGAELMRLTEAATGVLTGTHGEVIVRDVPVEREAMRMKFATPSPELRAIIFGLAVLYEYVS